MTFQRTQRTAVLDNLLGYGTSEGVKKSWEKRQRAQSRQMSISLLTKEGYLNADGLAQVGPQTGSNPGGLYQAPDGTRFYIKKGKSEDHARNEVLAAKLYEAAGARIPQVGLAVMGGNPAVASKIVSGLKYKPTPQEMIAAGAQEDFATDAWLQNWDAVGLEYDNMAIQQNGKILRMDTGGALRYRAQGGEKPPIPDDVKELDTLRTTVPGYHANPQAHSVFGSISNETLRNSMKKVAMVPDSTIRHLVLKFGPRNTDANKKLMNTLIARKEYITQKYKDMGGIL